MACTSYNFGNQTNFFGHRNALYCIFLKFDYSLVVFDDAASLYLYYKKKILKDCRIIEKNFILWHYLTQLEKRCHFKAYGGCLRPSIWTVTIFLKIYLFLFFATHCLLWEQTGDHRIKLASAFLPWGSRPEKSHLDGLTVPVAAAN
jgi:hypothetical protein